MSPIPLWLRDQVLARDGHTCRFCGLTQEVQVHHIEYGGDLRGMGGARVHDVDKMISLCAGCHERVHSRKRLYAPFLLEAVANPGTTVLSLARSAERAERERSA